MVYSFVLGILFARIRIWLRAPRHVYQW